MTLLRTPTLQLANASKVEANFVLGSDAMTRSDKEGTR
jgi:hypothetical protein